MRKLITAFKVSLDGKIEGPEGYAGWVDAWSDDYGLTAEIDACVLGAQMYRGYESYWSAMQNAPDAPLPMTGKAPTARELDWARFAANTPHYVLSTTLAAAQWPQTKLLRHVDEIAALKRASGKHIYLMGGARTAASLIDAGLVDEMRLLVFPVLAGGGKALWGALTQRRSARLLNAAPLEDGRVALRYALT